MFGKIWKQVHSWAQDVFVPLLIGFCLALEMKQYPESRPVSSWEWRSCIGSSRSRNWFAPGRFEMPWRTTLLQGCRGELTLKESTPHPWSPFFWWLKSGLETFSWQVLVDDYIPVFCRWLYMICLKCRSDFGFVKETTKQRDQQRNNQRQPLYIYIYIYD